MEVDFRLENFWVCIIMSFFLSASWSIDSVAKQSWIFNDKESIWRWHFGWNSSLKCRFGPFLHRFSFRGHSLSTACVLVELLPFKI